MPREGEMLLDTFHLWTNEYEWVVGLEGSDSIEGNFYEQGLLMGLAHLNCFRPFDYCSFKRSIPSILVRLLDFVSDPCMIHTVHRHAHSGGLL